MTRKGVGSLFLDADAMCQHMRTPMEDARQAEALLNTAADRTHARGLAILFREAEFNLIH